jgi:hypothetical protein
MSSCGGTRTPPDPSRSFRPLAGTRAPLRPPCSPLRRSHKRIGRFDDRPHARALVIAASVLRSKHESSGVPYRRKGPRPLHPRVEPRGVFPGSRIAPGEPRPPPSPDPTGVPLQTCATSEGRGFQTATSTPWASFRFWGSRIPLSRARPAVVRRPMSPWSTGHAGAAHGGAHAGFR